MSLARVGHALGFVQLQTPGFTCVLQRLFTRSALGVFQLRLANLARFTLGLTDDKSAATLIIGLVELFVCHSFHSSALESACMLR